MNHPGRPFAFPRLLRRVACLAASLAGMAGLAGTAGAMTSEELAAIGARRLQGDRTGACMAIAVVDQKAPATAYVCAEARHQARIDERTAFEVGSISKTFTAALLADRIAAGRMRLDDPLRLYLPEGSKVPAFEGKPITLRHLVTHTSGLPALPPRMVIRTPSNPYVMVTEKQLLDSLAEVTLTQAPGTSWAYSNFAVMVLSHVLSQQYQKDLETAARERLFAPLGMKTSFVQTIPAGVRVAQGHVPFQGPAGNRAARWDFPVNLAGMGGFRATLPDMVRYLEANLGLVQGAGAAAASAAVARTHDEVIHVGDTHMGMAWMMSPLFEHKLLMHEGHTGGFSSFIAFDKQRQRGVVILSDTAFNSLGGLSDLGLHLMDDRFPLSKPRTLTDAEPAMLDALAGSYRMDNGMEVTLRRRNAVLEMQVEGQKAFPMGHDSSGDFFPLAVDAVLRPQPQVGGYSFLWLQGGGVLSAKPIDAIRRVQAPLTTAALSEYAGDYPLRPNLTLRVFVLGNRLWGQATGQGAFPLDRVIPDVFFSSQPDLEIRFERKEAKVVAMTLRQGGNDTRAEMAPAP
jgi:D-alanyl-D-alanine-carboxypeptidase/D-alanyl-D-alanine-endopeptidase